jgi:hypothetical protein
MEAARDRSVRGQERPTPPSERRVHQRRPVRYRLAAAVLAAGAGVGCLGMGTLDPVAPIPEGIGVSVDGDTVVVHLRELANPNGATVVMCLRDVVILPADGGQESCEFEEVEGCLVMAKNTVVGSAPFRGRAVCSGVPEGWVRVMADVSFRERDEIDDPWQTTTILAEAKLELRTPHWDASLPAR